MGTDPKDSGEAERMVAWVRDHGPAVRGYLRGIIRNAHAADDLTQEVFTRAWTHRARYNEQGQSRAFLLRIADRLACDLLRRNKAEVARMDRIREEAKPDFAAVDPARKAVDAEAAQQVVAALEVLSPDQRRVLLLRYSGAMPFHEIAETLKIPLSTALSHCHRGLKMLRIQLAEREA